MEWARDGVETNSCQIPVEDAGSWTACLDMRRCAGGRGQAHRGDGQGSIAARAALGLDAVPCWECSRGVPSGGGTARAIMIGPGGMAATDRGDSKWQEEERTYSSSASARPSSQVDQSQHLLASHGLSSCYGSSWSLDPGAAANFAYSVL